MAVEVSQEHEPFQDGFGKSSRLGVGFVRKLTVDLNSAGTTHEITPANLEGCQKLYGILAIVPKSDHTHYVSAESESSITITSSANSAVYDVFVHVAGL